MSAEAIGGVLVLLGIAGLIAFAVHDANERQVEENARCIAAFSRVHVATDTTAILLVKPSCGDVLRSTGSSQGAPSE